MKITVFGIDLGKNSCSMVGLDGAGQVVIARRMQRDSAIKFASGLAPCVVAMEACCGAHQLGRIMRDHGHQVRLMSSECDRPYVKAQKNDDRDAQAIAEAATRPTMRFVELKSAEQLDMQSLHRVRDRLVGLLYWDGTGVVLVAKTLEQGTFRWPRAQDGVIRLTASQLGAVLDGLDWARVHTRRRTRVPAEAH